MQLKKLKKNSDPKNKLEDSFKIIYDEITQDLCVVKLTLSMSDSDPDQLKANIKKSHDLVSKSIQQLRIVGDLINEIKKIQLQKKND